MKQIFEQISSIISCVVYETREISVPPAYTYARTQNDKGAIISMFSLKARIILQISIMTVSIYIFLFRNISFLKHKNHSAVHFNAGACVCKK